MTFTTESKRLSPPTLWKLSAFTRPGVMTSVFFFFFCFFFRIALEKGPYVICGQRGSWSDCACAVWSEPSLSAYKNSGHSKYISTNRKDLDQSLGNQKLIWPLRSAGRGWGVASYIWHGTDVRAECPPFSALPGIWLAPLFSTKSIWLIRFFWIRMWKAQFSDIPIYAYIFRSEVFLSVFSELTAIFVKLQTIHGYKNQGVVYG